VQCVEGSLKIESARYVSSVVRSADFIRDSLPQVAFAGRSNVGKSSLLNRLLGRKSLARISSAPGKTRAINYFLINSRFYFVDLPGYGYAKVSKTERRSWAELMDEYLRQGASSAQLIQLVDAKVGVTPLDVEAFEYFTDLDFKPTLVATKIDRVSGGKRKRQIDEIQRALAQTDTVPISFSARTDEGVSELWKEITAFLQSTGGEAN